MHQKKCLHSVVSQLNWPRRLRRVFAKIFFLNAIVPAFYSAHWGLSNGKTYYVPRQTHAACEVLHLSRGFDEHDLYDNLAWLADNQGTIESRLFTTRRGDRKPTL